MEITGFIFDTSSWIAAWREQYPSDIFPDVWQLLKRDISKAIIRSPTKVQDELRVKEEDTLFEWVEKRKEIFEIRIDTHQVPTIIANIRQPDRKLSETDATIIAYAQIKNLHVITEERKISKVCGRRDIKCGKLRDYLRIGKTPLNKIRAQVFNSNKSS